MSLRYLAFSCYKCNSLIYHESYTTHHTKAAKWVRRNNFASNELIVFDTYLKIQFSLGFSEEKIACYRVLKKRGGKQVGLLIYKKYLLFTIFSFE